MLGIHLTILAGNAVPLPLPMRALDALSTIEITRSVEGRSGIQAEFKAGRGSTLAELADYPIMKTEGLKVGARIAITLTLGIKPAVLFDGIVTQAQLNPGQGEGDGTLAVTAEDMRFAMDQDELDAEYPGMPAAAIAAQVIAKYAQYGLVPVIIPPPVTDVPLPMDRVTTQSETDLAFLERLAAETDYIFAVEPGKIPLTNTAYFGPPPLVSVPQPALTVNMGPDTNVASIDFQYDASEAHAVEGEVQDRTTNQTVPVNTVPPTRPPLATSPAHANSDTSGTRRLRPNGAVSATAAMAQAQAEANASSDVLTAQGQLDGTRYGRVLEPRKLVGLRGAGLAHDGLWYVKEVKHKLKRGEYLVDFGLVREGLGSTLPVVPV
jgi:phage protein D